MRNMLIPHNNHKINLSNNNKNSKTYTKKNNNEKIIFFIFNKLLLIHSLIIFQIFINKFV